MGKSFHHGGSLFAHPVKGGAGRQSLGQEAPKGKLLPLLLGEESCLQTKVNDQTCKLMVKTHE